MTHTKERYAQIEKEALAITWVCDQFSDYLMGLVFHVETDHKPLEPLLSAQRLNELPLRIQRFCMRTMRYTYTISHVPGKSLVTADTLSRAPEEGRDEDTLQEETEMYVHAIFESIAATERRLEEIRMHQEEDEITRQIATYCQTGWPARNVVPAVIKPYYSVASVLSVEKGLLMRGSRVVIPSSLRVDMLYRLHAGHQGISKSRERAKHSMWWPGLEEVVKSCPQCVKHSTPRVEPLLPSKLPQLPWQKVATDLLFWNNSTYLLFVDYYSRWIEVSKLDKLTSEEVINHTCSIFGRHGIPEIVISDNGPQYSVESYAAFTRQYGFEHITHKETGKLKEQ